MTAARSDVETSKAIEVFAMGGEVRALMEGCMHNKEVYNEIVQGMAEVRYDRTTVQCRDEVKKLNNKCKKLKRIPKQKDEGRDE